MNDEDRIALGEYCERLLGEDLFTVLVQQFEMQCFQSMMRTDPKALKEREGIYAQFRGLNDFLEHLRACVLDKDGVYKRIAELSEQDAHIEGID